MPAALDIAHTLARVLCAGLAAGLAAGALAWLVRALWRLSRDVRVFGLAAVRPALIIALLVALPSVALAWGPMIRSGGRLLRSVGRSMVTLWIPASEIGTTIAGSRGETVTTARNSTATYLDGSGVLRTASANQPRVDANGLLVEPQATNLALQSENLGTGSGWTATDSTVTVNQGVFADGQQTMDLVATIAGANRMVWRGVPVTGTGPWTMSGWMAAASDSHVGGLALQCGSGNATGCSCKRFDGASCTATISGNTCITSSTYASSAPVRASVTTSCTLASTSVYALVSGGQFNVAGDSILVGGIQFETGTSATAYIPTTTTATVRLADVISFAIPTGSRSIGYDLDGTHETADITAATSPLTIGIGQQVEKVGHFRNVKLCRAEACP